jgi:hypothetical protein
LARALLAESLSLTQIWAGRRITGTFSSNRPEQ